MKTISCGVIILNELNEILMCHSTGNKFYDLPKGKMEKNETFEQTAVRETLEETGLDLKDKKLIFLGQYKYIPAPRKKDLCLFLYKVKKDEIKIDELDCSTYTEINGSNKKEVDGYKWIHINEIKKNTTIRMGNILSSII